MTFISYAQNHEDVILWRALKDIEAGFYIDVGACWPEHHSVTRSFYERGWRGINIEPNPEFFQQLLERRVRDINLDCAISDQNGHGQITILNSTGLSTMDEVVASMHRTSGYSATVKNVDTVTLQYVCETYVQNSQPIHFLKVDVEGFEEKVLRSNDWQVFRPWIVVVEATVPMSQTESYENWEETLQTAGYRLCYADGLNRFYLAEEHSKLVSAFDYPPNIFDEFVTHIEWDTRQRLIDARRDLNVANRDLNVARERAEASRLELHALYNSASWRMTRPLRSLGDGIRSRNSLLMRLFTAAFRAIRRVPAFVLRGLLSVLSRFPCVRAGISRVLDTCPSAKARLRSLIADARDPNRLSIGGFRRVPHDESSLTRSGREVYRRLINAMEERER